MVPRDVRDDEVEVFCREAELTLKGKGENRKISGCLQGLPRPFSQCFTCPRSIVLPPPKCKARHKIVEQSAKQKGGQWQNDFRFQIAD